MRIELVFRVLADGLVGGDVEGAPYLGVRATFGAYRQPKRVDLQQNAISPTQYVSTGTVGPYVMDHVAGEFRGDESFWVELFSNTNTSGIEDIDKVETGQVTRNINSGTLQLPLGKLLASVNPATGLGSIEHEDMINTELLSFLLTTERTNTQVQPNVARALANSHKAWFSVDVRILDCPPSVLQALVKTLSGPMNASGTGSDWVRNGKTGALLYVPANYAKFAAALDPFISLYADRYIGHIDAKTGKIVGKPMFDTTNENIKGLHFAIYRSQVGMLPIGAFWSHAFMQRQWASEADRAEASRLYGYTLATERYFESMFIGACRRFGMTGESYVIAVETQLARGLDDATVSSEYRNALDITADFGTFTANSIYYGQDQRFANAKRMHEPSEPEVLKNNGPIGLESWDITGLTLLSKTLDCEDMGNISTSGLRSLAYGREDVASNVPRLSIGFVSGSWDSPVLKAAQRVLEQYVLLDAGGAVTAAYIGADGKKLEKKDIKELPRVNDASDKRNTTGGHAYGLMVPEARVAMWLVNGGITDSPLGKKKYAKWQYAQTFNVLEGTGPSPHNLLPAAEIFEGGEQSLDFKKSDAMRAFVRETLAADMYKPLIEAFRPYAVPFYTKRVEPDRRISTFYRESVHVASADMYTKHHGLSQLTFINRLTGERGIDTASLARDGIDGNASKSMVALDAPFYKHVALWDANMVPVMEAMVNQMPLTALGQVPLYNLERPMHFGVLTPATLESRIASNTLSTQAPHWTSSPVLIARPATVAASLTATPTADSVRALAPWAANAVDQLSNPDQTPVHGKVHWAALYNVLSWYNAHVSTGNTNDAEAPTVVARAVEYTMPTTVDAQAAVISSGVSWDSLGKGQDVCMRGTSRRFAVTQAAMHRDSSVGNGAVQLVVNLCEDTRIPVEKNTLTLLHLGVFSRIFALAPIVIAAAGVTNTLLNTPRMDIASGSYVHAVSTDDHGGWRITVSLPSALHVTQAFCTDQSITAAPWITVDMNANLPVLTESSLVMQHANSLMGFDLGAIEDQPSLSPFIDCYKRTDAVLVRFMGHEWSFRKNREATLACIERLYKSGILLAHEFALCSPLPQSDDVLEMHMLIKV
jgi:hypothetical protein